MKDSDNRMPKFWEDMLNQIEEWFNNLSEEDQVKRRDWFAMDNPHLGFPISYESEEEYYNRTTPEARKYYNDFQNELILKFLNLDRN